MSDGWYALIGAIVAIAAQDYRQARPDSGAHTTAAQFLAAAGLLGRLGDVQGRGVSISYHAQPASRRRARRCA